MPENGTEINEVRVPLLTEKQHIEAGLDRKETKNTWGRDPDEAEVTAEENTVVATTVTNVVIRQGSDVHNHELN